MSASAATVRTSARVASARKRGVVVDHDGYVDADGDPVAKRQYREALLRQLNRCFDLSEAMLEMEQTLGRVQRDNDALRAIISAAPPTEALPHYAAAMIQTLAKSEAAMQLFRNALRLDAGSDAVAEAHESAKRRRRGESDEQTITGVDSAAPATPPLIK
jgi:hypothetical protein